MEISEKSLLTVLEQIVDTQNKIIDKLYQMPEELLISPDAACKKLGGMSVKTLYKMCDDPKCPLKSVLVGESSKRRIIAATIGDYVKTLYNIKQGDYHSNWENIKKTTRVTNEELTQLVRPNKYLKTK